MRCLIVLLLIASLIIPLHAQSDLVENRETSYQDFLLTSPGAMTNGLYGYYNPAVLNYLDGFNLSINWTDYTNGTNFSKWGMFTNIYKIGFGFIHQNINGYKVTDYKIALGAGSRLISYGLSFGWSSGEINLFDRKSNLTLGFLVRPSKYLSVGITGSNSISGNIKHGYTELAFRPFGNEILSLFGDYNISNLPLFNGKKKLWSAGAAVEPLQGLRITGRYLETKQLSAGIQLSLGNIGFTSQSHFDSEQKYSYNTYGIRIGSYDRNILPKIFPSRKYLEINLLGEMKYQRFRFFDNSSVLYSIIEQIHSAKEDKNISGIAINTSGMNISYEMLWEIRNLLKDFKKTGKKVIIYADRLTITSYHFVSVADKIVLDPLGSLFLKGFIAGRTYFDGTIEKLGLELNEWRFFKYKSAMESFSRTNMSEGDSIQWKQYIDDLYKIAKEEICSERKISPEDFDEIINEKVMIIPEEAIKIGLIDTLGRWDSITDVIIKMEGKEVSLTSSLEKFKLPHDNHWGEYDQIAIIYALGICDMDEGISARNLVKDVESAVNDSRIKAIVLRVDSPGGDGMASDYIAEALKKAKGKKPVIVSQGSVAGSGGYWLSMYGDTIVSSPVSITGSIGVIGGWIYNKYFKEKTGISTDYVKIGKHADFGFGATLPLIGLTIPDRDLTDEEFQKMKETILYSYQEFLSKVAAGRNLSTEHVDSVGEGRIWTGLSALDKKLVDILGGLNDALIIAKEKAGLKGKEVRIIQYPKMPLFNINFWRPKFFGIEIEESEFFKYLKFRLENNGIPMPILSLDQINFTP